MESKRSIYTATHHKHRTFNRTSMESKRSKYTATHHKHRTFNRTSMESKRGQSFLVRGALQLLIEPVWNRNTLAIMIICSCVRPFNRTSMESKLDAFLKAKKAFMPFNRTSMESKRCLMSQMSSRSPDF